MNHSQFDFRNHVFIRVLGFNARHWRRQPLRIALLFTGFLLVTVADVLTPYFAGRLVDAVGGGTRAVNSALVAVGTMLALVLFSVILRPFCYVSINDLTLRMMSDIAQDAFHRVQRFSSDWHANAFAGSTVRKITRGMWALDTLNNTIVMSLFPSLVMLVASTILLGTLSPVMALIVGLGSILLITVIVVLSTLWVAPAASLANSWDSRLGGALADAVSCNAVVKAFGAEEREEERVAQVFRKWRDRTRRVWRRGVFNGTLQGAMLLTLRSAIIGTAILLWFNGEASAGDIAFVLTASFMLQGYLRDIGQHVRNLQHSINDMEELVVLHSSPLGIDDRLNARDMRITDGLIAFEHVDFQYGRHLAPLYKGLNVTIAASERVGLVGPSGSGKTTFVKLIQRLYDVCDGQITIDGVDLRNFTQASLRGQIAVVQQEPVLFHRSLAENIAYAHPGASRNEIIRTAMLANVHDFIESLPKGYDTMVGERGVKLSGGERQRVAIARAFLSNARVLIFDEATSSLDSESEVLIQQAMERLMVGRTTIVIAHRLSTVRKLDRLLVFDYGKIVEEGTHEQLIRRDSGIYRKLFDRQALELTKGLVPSRVS